MMFTTKTIAGTVIFGLSFGSGVSSFVTIGCVIKRVGISPRVKRTMGILNCFSGGVFLAASIIDLLPEAREKMHDALEKLHPGYTYPYTELLLGAGVLMVLCIESCAQACLKQKKSRTADGSESFEFCPIKLTSVCRVVSRRCFKNPAQSRESNGKHRIQKIGIVSGNFPAADDNGNMENDSEPDDEFELVHLQNDDTTALLSDDEETMFQGTSKSLMHGTPSNCDEDLTHDSIVQVQSQTHRVNMKRLRNVALLLALSFHMIFDGIALGLLEDDNKILRLLLALSFHKLLVFFTIGIQITTILKTQRRALLVVLLFALVTPFGILIGDSLTSEESSVTRDAVAAILQGLATGTFLFVTFFEILHRELGLHAHDCVKVIATILGYGLIAAIRLFQEG